MVGDRANLRRVIIAGILCNSLELYDYTLYGFFAAIIAAKYFPSDNYVTSLLMTYGIFASGFFLRPLGAIFFGWVGDQYGRKRALEICVLMMAIPTLVIGLLPSYQILGITAPIILTLMRMLQGVSVSGELVGSYAYLVEHAEDHEKGLVGSWALVGNFGGKLLGAIIVGLMTLVCTNGQLEDWGWRIPFVIGLFFALFGFYLRKRISETPIFKEIKEKHQVTKVPIVEALKKNSVEMFQAFGYQAVQTAFLHLFFIYMPIFLVKEVHLSYFQAMFLDILAIGLTMVCVPIGAFLSDCYGRRPLMVYGSAVIAFLLIPYFWVITTQTFMVMIVAQAVTSIVFGIQHGVIPVVYTEIFDPKVRYTASALSYNFSVCLFGGVTPLIATGLIAYTGSIIAPSFWVLVCGFVTLISLMGIKETGPVKNINQGCIKNL